jgi:hypothetical protein
MNKRGYYIKKSKVDQSLFLFIELNDFVEYVKANIKDGSNNWVKFRIFEREKIDEKFSHNMELVKER